VKRGSAEAIKLLTGPPFPEAEAMTELWERFQVLGLGRRMGMTGPERIAITDIEAANRLLDWDLQPHEIKALMHLDLVTLYPKADQKP
jgi:hypothetical protein